MSIIAEVNECRNCGKDLPIGVIYCLDCTFYNNLKKDKEMSIFKKGDVVYHYAYGQGIVQEINHNDPLGVPVSFDHHIGIIKFNSGGWIDDGTPTLSFTPYDLIKGGFSQERPKPEIQKGTVIYVKDRDSQLWKTGYFNEFKNGYVFIQLKKEVSPVLSFDEYSLENPLI